MATIIPSGGVDSDLRYVLHDSRVGNGDISRITINKIKFVKIINLLHVSEPWCHLQKFFQFKETQ